MKKDHPEIKNIKNICDISPNTKTTKSICDVLNKNKLDKKTKHKNPDKL